MNRWLGTGLLMVLMAVLAGCGGSSAVQPGGLAGPAVGGAGGGSGSASTGAAGSSGIGGVQPLSEEQQQQQQLRQNMVIYFDFDQSDIRQEFLPILAAHGRYLADNPNVTVRLEGHTDERGSREYNIGLGERRAQAVRQVLLLQGASPAQITTVSYGEERPAVQGTGEDVWAKNRRVEIVYR
jgi:peptidoglycan-associated lipoprotein